VNPCQIVSLAGDALGIGLARGGRLASHAHHHQARTKARARSKDRGQEGSIQPVRSLGIDVPGLPCQGVNPCQIVSLAGDALGIGLARGLDRGSRLALPGRESLPDRLAFRGSRLGLVRSAIGLPCQIAMPFGVPGLPVAVDW
jgi:hypothetical protein